jgi:16S rRNA processing protein RimM
MQGGETVLKIDELTDRTEAESARGGELLALREHLPEPASGEWYLADLVGSAVVTEEGEDLGTLDEVLHLPANDVYIVRGKRGEILLPATDEVIRSVDTASRKIQVRLLPGLAERGNEGQE